MDAELNAGTIAGSGAHMEVSSEVEKEHVPDCMEVESDHKDDMPSPGQTQSKNIIGDASQRQHNNASSYASRAKQTSMSSRNPSAPSPPQPKQRS